MRNYFLGLLLLIGTAAFGQSYSELGVYAGTAFYMGDINTNSPFYNSKLAIGGVFRHNFSERYALRANVLFSDLSANDKDFNNTYQQKRNKSFATDIIDMSLQLEFNFQPFWAPKKSKTKQITPYITAGIGYLASNSTEGSITIPMGLGMKCVLGERWTLAAEWSFRKTFTDSLDNLSDPNQTGVSNLLHNNDWASFCGVTISYRIFSNDTECHSYGNKLEK